MPLLPIWFLDSSPFSVKVEQVEIIAKKHTWNKSIFLGDVFVAVAVAVAVAVVVA